MSFWDDQRIAELKDRWDKNESATQICLAMGISRNAVIGKSHRLGLAARANKHHNGARRSNASRRRKVLVTTPPKPEPQVCENPKSLLELRRCDCRWPISGNGAETLFCAAPAVEGKAFCPAHCRRAFEPPLARQKKNTPAPNTTAGRP